MVSCLGLMADRMLRMLGLEPGFSICPFLGVHLTQMIDGSVTVGPNSVLALKHEGYRKRDFSVADTFAMLSNPGILNVLKD